MARSRPRGKNKDMLLKSAEMIGWAIGGIEREIMHTRERLASLTEQAATLRARLGGAAAKSGTAVTHAAEGAARNITKAGRRTMSPEARKRISDMMKKRWAERRKAKKTGRLGKS
jgi:hypothetical protein